MFIQQQHLRYTRHRHRSREGSGVHSTNSCEGVKFTPSQEFDCGVFCCSDTHETFTKINAISARLTPGAALVAYQTFLIAGSTGRRPEPNWSSLQLSPRPHSWWGGEQHRSLPIARLLKLRCYSDLAISIDLHNVVHGLAPVCYTCTVFMNRMNCEYFQRFSAIRQALDTGRPDSAQTRPPSLSSSGE